MFWLYVIVYTQEKVSQGTAMLPLLSGHRCQGHSQCDMQGSLRTQDQQPLSDFGREVLEIRVHVDLQQGFPAQLSKFFCLNSRVPEDKNIDFCSSPFPFQKPWVAKLKQNETKQKTQRQECLPLSCW